MAPPLPEPPAHLAPLLTGLGVKPLTARRGTEHGFGLGAGRWSVGSPTRTPAASLAWPSRF